jgi:hypothetical protein
MASPGGSNEPDRADREAWDFWGDCASWREIVAGM